jgi:protein SCO1/2
MRIVSALAVVLAAVACDAPPDGAAAEAVAPPTTEPSVVAPDEDLAVGEASDESLYLLDATWTDHRGRPFRLGQLRGHPALVVMFYGTCHGACPVLVHDLQTIDAALPPEARAEVRYVLATFDPARDTEERLAAMADEDGLDERWSFVRGSDDQARELAAVLGVRYRAVPGGEIRHSNLITLLDGAGVVAARSEGLMQPPGPIVARITAATTGPRPGSVAP